MDKSWRLLLVDDDEEDQWLVKKSFATSGGLVVDAVGNGQEALNYLHDESREYPDLILLDLNMPVMDGPAFMREFKVDTELPRIPIVVLTTSDQEEFVQQAYELGAAAYLVKPPTLPDFEKLASSLEHFWRDCVTVPKRIRGS